MFVENIFKKVLKNKFILFELYLSKSNSNIKKFFKINYIIYFVVLCLNLILFILNYISLIPFILILFSLPLIIFFTYNFELLKEENRQKEIDNQIQEVLLQASLFPKGTEITRIIEYISKQNYKYLSLEFNIVLKQIKKGLSANKALEEITKRNKSILLKRIVNLLIIGYKSGKDMQFVFNKISQYIVKTHELERERYSSLSIQKYTLIISSSVLVPLILGWVQNIVQNFDLSAFTSLDIAIGSVNLSNYAFFATWIYLIELSLISSYFIALIDGNKKKTFFYILFILPISLLIFFLV